MTNLCEDDELRSLLLELKHKHDLIMKSQQKNKSSLSRRSSSTGSHGKVVRRASLSERTNLYRREYEKEAVVWQCLAPAGDMEGSPEEEESSPDTERRDPLDPEPDMGTPESFHEPLFRNGFCSPLPFFYCPPPIAATPKPTLLPNGNNNPSRTCYTPEPLWRGILDQTPLTLSELKRQRAAAKVGRFPLGSNSDSQRAGGKAKNYPCSPGTPPWHANGGAPVYYTASSGDPPILRLKSPMEEEEEGNVLRCCRIS
ncbi:LOW QUALITY PROTEIN: protein phosphatase 1 regulatory inhibitor subunit 16B-like [Ascaphus truei]|uniref:LOW QUALITY PROTEIN: protein phosphatase 1 regulatory inhibitor subunit 16B-like n=1 Tax=Ascaphus truei TaxID=8439 RepID=UPI003F597AE9